MRYIVMSASAAILAAAGLFAWIERYPAIAPIEPPAASAFDSTLIDKGRGLVALGDCAVCHTRPGGDVFAGGLKLPTPFGVIYSTNITPDPKTGIGRWSEAAFTRAMHDGIDRGGNYLYPAFPYDHFTKITNDDIKAIYAYLMTRTPVTFSAPKNELIFPIRYRFVVAGWNLLFLRHGVFTPDPSKDTKWNRGAYLVEGLGHCGGCHTPRNFAGAEKHSQPYAGGEAEGWHAPALNDASPAPLPWSSDALINYFLDGWDKDHGIAGGPMTDVVNELAALPESDVSAIATYILSFQNQLDLSARTKSASAFAAEREFNGPVTPMSGPPNRDAATAAGRGQALFAKSCANCHRAGGQTVPLALTSTVNGPDPRNLIHVISRGIQPPKGSPDQSMPAFGGSLSDDNFADLVAFVRHHFSKQPAWSGIPALVKSTRSANN